MVLPSPVPAARLVALGAQVRSFGRAFSHDAGDYLCNESFYLSLLMDRRASFVHVPNWRGKPARSGGVRLSKSWREAPASCPDSSKPNAGESTWIVSDVLRA